MGVFTFDATFRTKYQDEFKMDFERNTAELKIGVRSDGVVRAETVKWDVVDPGDTANTRGRGGDIPISEIGFSQVSGTLAENFKKYRIDSFDEFRGNPNVRSAMSARGIGSVNRAIDQAIVDAMDASATAITTSTNGASNQASTLSTLANINHWMKFLLAADVPMDGEIYAAISVNAYFQLQRIAEFKSADYVDMKVIPGGPATKRVLRWQGVNWLMFNGLSGAGTNACKMYMWHKSAIGHQVSGDPEAHPYYYEPQDRFECWFKAMHVAKTCLSRGIVRFYHDDTAAFA